MNSGLDHANTRSLHRRKRTCRAPQLAAAAPAGSRPDGMVTSGHASHSCTSTPTPGKLKTIPSRFRSQP